MKDFARGSARPPDIVIVLIVVLLRLSLPTSQLLAQTDHLRFEPLTIDDGLSQNLVYSILQDRKGFMWFGTKDGLNRYDGYRFTVFRHDPYDSISISGNEVRVLFEDRAGTLWIGATGLNRFDSRTETFSRYLNDAANPNSLSHNDVRALAEDHTGALWIGTTNGLNRLAPERAGSFTRYFHDPDNQQSLSHNQITALLVDRRGTLWIGTPQGLNALPSGSTSGFIRYHLNDDFVNYLYEDRQGLLWAGTASGLFRLDPRGDGAQTFQHYSLLSAPHLLRWEKSITAIQERPDGKFWVGTYTGLVVFDPQTGTSYSIRHDPRDPHSLSFDVILSVCQDRGGVVWFGTSGRGLNKLNLYAKPFHHYGGKGQRFSELSGFSVKAILEDQSGALWIVANDRVYQLDRAANQWQRFQAVALPVGSIIEEPQGVLWFHSGSGFFKFDPRGKRMSFVQSGLGNEDNFTVITVDGVRNSVARVTGLLARARSLNLKGIFVHRIYRDAGGVFWLAGDAGLIRLNPADSSVHSYRNDPRNPSSLSYDVVYSILPDPRDPDRFLWLGTAGGGLNRLEIATEKFIHYTEKDGLPNNVVYGILPDRHGRLWMSTNRGLSQFDPATGAFRNFDVRDGLQSNEFNRNAYFLSRKGEMFFGGINGLNAFYPDSIRNNPHAPPIVITDFQLAYQPVSFRDPHSPLRQPISETDEIRLRHNQNTIAFEFVPLDFAEPGKNRYAYMLENLDPQWVQAGTNRKATYTNLAPGHYVFRVKAANNDGIWNEEGASIRITITPPWWKTWWFRIGSALAILGLMISAHRLRTAYIEARNRALEQEVAERKEAEAKFRGVLESAPDAMLVTNERGNILLINTQAEKLFGYSREELAGHSVETLVPPALRDKHVQHRRNFHEHINQRPMGIGHELAVLRKDGSEIPVEITLSPLESRDGIWVIAAVRDITERKRMIDELQNSRNHLRALTGHLHDVMERERISIAQDIHDELGGVLTALKIDLTLLERGLEKNAADDLSLNEIRAMKQTIDATVRKMREFVRRLRPEVLDDLGLVAALEWQMQEFHLRLGVVYEFKSEAAALAVEESCAIAVFRIFQEALTNIARHANASKVMVHIRQNQGHAHITISDNGIGMPAEKLASPDTFGLLGMRERALMFGGEVEIASAPGHGTTVIIKVPLAR